MSLAWLLPAGFLALAAWLVPLLIHLARRSEHRVTSFAALRWLSARPRPRRRIRFDDWPLLLVRLLLIAAIAALLARPVLSGAPDRRPWLVATPPVSAAQARAAASEPTTQLHWLEPGFPQIQSTSTAASAAEIARKTGDARDDRHVAGASSGAAASVTSLLRELDHTLPVGTPLTVLVPATLDGVDAQRPRLSRRVEWVVVPDAMPDTARRAPAIAPRRADAPTLDLRSDADHRKSLRYLRAAAVAWQQTSLAGADRDDGPGVDPETTPRGGVNPTSAKQSSAAPTAATVDAPSPPAPPAASITAAAVRVSALDAPPPPATRRLVWLASAPMPATIWRWIDEGGVALVADDTQVDDRQRPDSSASVAAVASTVIWRNGDGQPLARAWPHGRGRVLQLTRPLRPDAMPLLLDAGFPDHLRALLAGPSPAPARVDAASHAPVLGARPGRDTPRSLAAWLVLLVVLLWALERWMAAARPRGPTA